MGNRKGKKARLNLHATKKKCLNLQEYNRCIKNDLPFPTKHENINANFSRNTATSINSISVDEHTQCQISDSAEVINSSEFDKENLENRQEISFFKVLPEENNVYDFHPTGRRIIDINGFFTSLQNFEHHGLFSCSFKDVCILKEQRLGFRSKFFLKCKICSNAQTIDTDSNADENMEINKALVLGTISSGNGFAQLEEIMAFCNIPCMNEHTYAKNQEAVAPNIREAALEIMEEAGKEEKLLAIEAGDVDSDGIPFVTVIADGAWCKRSYKTNYDANSGVGVIIGQRTGKILFLGIRNKYCCVCSRASSKKESPSEHICYKNWTKASTAMESDIILEGFKQSIPMHGLKYLYLIGDGDSSITKKLFEYRPYGTRLVNKIECKNHLLRNYCTRLRELTKKRISSKKMTVSVQQRNHLNNNIRRLRCAVQCAVQYRINETSNNDHQLKVENLKKDIENSINHVFGDHRKCESYYCKKQDTSNEYNWIPNMKESGLYDDICFYLNRLSRNAGSLILNMDNNAAERYNSIVAKFIGGKRVNFASRGSFEMRCQAASVHYNINPGQYPIYISEKISCKSPGKYTKIYGHKRDIRSKWIKNQKIENPDKFKKRKLLFHAPPDKEYGDVEEHSENNTISLNEYNNKAEEFIKNLTLTPSEIIKLQIETQLQSNDPNCKWREERSKRLTASKFGQICKMKSKTHCANTVRSMLYKEFSGNAHTKWGKENEKNAANMFETINNIKIEPCGLFVDKIKPYLAASPDGLIGEDGIVEIKCPSTSKALSPFQGILEKRIKFAEIRNDQLYLKRNSDYYFQIQGQLHVTMRDYCTFVIWTEMGIETEKIMRDDNFWKNQMEEKLTEFYFKCLLPEIIDPQYPKELPIKDLRK